MFKTVYQCDLCNEEGLDELDVAIFDAPACRYLSISRGQGDRHVCRRCCETVAEAIGWSKEGE